MIQIDLRALALALALIAVFVALAMWRNRRAAKRNRLRLVEPEDQPLDVHPELGTQRQLEPVYCPHCHRLVARWAWRAHIEAHDREELIVQETHR